MVDDARWRKAVTSAQADEQVALAVKRGEVATGEIADHLASCRAEIVETLGDALSAELRCEADEIAVKSRWDRANRALARWINESGKPRMIAAFLMSNPGPKLGLKMTQEEIEITLGLASLTRALTHLPIQFREPLPATDAPRTQRLFYVSATAALASLLVVLSAMLVVWLRQGRHAVAASLAAPWSVVGTSAAAFGATFLVTAICALLLFVNARRQQKAIEEVGSLVLPQAQLLGKADSQDLDRQFDAAKAAYKAAVRHSDAVLNEKLRDALHAYISQKREYEAPGVGTSHYSPAPLAAEDLPAFTREVGSVRYGVSADFNTSRPVTQSVRTLDIANADRNTAAGNDMAVASQSQQQGAFDQVSAPSDTKTLRVFLCHASQDKPKVRALYQKLTADGFDVWLDEECLLPGQDWALIDLTHHAF